MTSSPNRWIRRTSTGSVLLSASIAAAVSFRHMHELALAHGESTLTAALVPLSVDGTVVSSSMALLLRAGTAGGAGSSRGRCLSWRLTRAERFREQPGGGHWQTEVRTARCPVVQRFLGDLHRVPAGVGL
ncbi:DUF2637 domain-containing protein [Microbispora sp. H10670]|uniref:DUF2637 domain-containing protein n=1 Tax=Microbispora sp. H10670 TaxID=2729108 RepID=UPI002873E7D4|nr:DUF2637 domain-containing protein [Microbispora sp. H10670]